MMEVCLLYHRKVQPMDPILEWGGWVPIEEEEVRYDIRGHP